MIDTYRRIWSLLTGPERRQFLLLLLAMLVMAVFDVAGVGAILPFLSVVADPSLLDTNPRLARLADLLGLDTARAATVGLGVAVLLLIVAGTAVRALVTFAQFRFALMRSYTLGSRLLHGYLARDYAWQLGRNSAELNTVIISEVDQAVRESILPAILLISSGLVLLMMTALIVAAAPGVMFVALAPLVAIYMLIFMSLRRRLTAAGHDRVTANGLRFRTLQEIGGGIKEIKVSGIEAHSLRRFRASALAFVRSLSAAQSITRMPRFALEASIYGGFVLTVLLMILWRGDEVAELLPLFGLLAMAATRLFPSLQTVYTCLGQMRFSAPALERVAEALREMPPLPLPLDPPAPLPLREAIELRDLGFRYPGAERPAFAGLSLRVPARSSAGFVGGTGAGKTTLLDTVLGILAPETGEILVDGVPLGPGNLRAWQRNIGYVPQHIFLVDDSIAANIALGAGRAGPDPAAIERAARIAHLHDFIMGELPEGYATRVGERGVRLSGGQRQRVGIARALYHDPDVLILDEATSALDTVTEGQVMEALEELAGSKTVLMIAHRLTTVRTCDRIFLLEGGRIVASGRYEDLLRDSDRFRAMAAL